ncbi:MAG: FecR family protein [Ferruginibacter sp.]|uniref:FecR family protein n=1 Tax=Ferruginibacter sp. TaxID=1940288 RepID=UPI0026589BEE|nr:FecR domain-containing protein [Ferruginibacter sp.]MDB5277402.1 FecR family protein [Ferruginibacter sp.]
MIDVKHDIEDLLLMDSFINYCKHSDQDDVKYWENYIQISPAHAALVAHARERYIELFNALADADLEEQVTRLKNSIDSTSAAPVIRMESVADKKRRNIFRLAIKVAAVVFIITGLFIARGYFNKNTAGDIQTYAAAYGERKTIQLPDGSSVAINSGSTVRINQHFGLESRDVYLQGEAFFEVKHNAKIPFIVHTAAMEVKALGTAFNVKAYQNELFTETALIRGLVEVTLIEENNLKLVLHPNEKIKWKTIHIDSTKASESTVLSTSNIMEADSLRKKIVATNDGIIKEIAWKADKLIFFDEEFDEIARLLERWYNVKINFEDDALRNYHFSGVFEKEDLITVLNFLKESRHFNYTIKDDTIVTINLSK